MRPAIWGLIFSVIGFIGWVFFSFVFALAKIVGSETVPGVFFISTFGILMLFALPVGLVFDFARKRSKLKYLGYGLIVLALIFWAGAFSAGIVQETSTKPIVVRSVNIVKEGDYVDNVFVSSFPPFGAQYGEFKIDVSIYYLKPFMGPDYVVVKDFTIITGGFEIIAVEPKVPFNVGSSSITFTLTVKGPREGFEGPLTVKVTLLKG